MAETSRPPQSQTKIVVPGAHPMVSLLGSRDELLRVIEKAFRSDIHVRGNEITITGEPAENAQAVTLFEELITLLDRGDVLTRDSVERSLAMLRAATPERPAEVLTLNVLSSRGRTIRPKTVNQKRYVDAIDAHTIVFGIGPAGTGKTYLAMAKAVQALQAKAVNRIILTRPAVEAGERLGFLPGTLYEKIDPYLRPLYDALHDMLDPESIPRLMTAGTIEVAPLAYMRGRSQPVETPVLTPSGFRRIGALRVGDLVVGSNGQPTPVLGIYPQGRRPVFRVTASDGASTLACGEHLWFVTTRDDRRHHRSGRVLETRQMIGALRRASAHRFELPLVAPVEFEPRAVPIEPYALGLLLGDGCLTTATTPTFTTGDPELVAAVEHAVPGLEMHREGTPESVLRHVDGRRGGVIVANPVTVAWRELNLDGTGPTTKFVPAAYLHNSVSVRLAVLQGLLDTDAGPVRQRGHRGRIRYPTCSDRLRDDVVWLVRSLGGVAYARTREAAGRIPDLARDRPLHHRDDVYVVDIRLPAGVAPFRLASKRAAYRAGGGGRPMRFVDSIEPVGATECVCIAVGAQDSLYVAEDFLVTHNTLNDAFIILDEAQNSSAEQMKMFLTRLGFGSKIVVTGDVTQVDLPAGTVSGLRVVQGILDGIPDVHFATLTSGDVVRHKLVSEIVDAYARHDATASAPRAAPDPRRSGRSGRGR